jgi:hypothetical protein
MDIGSTPQNKSQVKDGVEIVDAQKYINKSFVEPEECNEIPCFLLRSESAYSHRGAASSFVVFSLPRPNGALSAQPENAEAVLQGDESGGAPTRGKPWSVLPGGTVSWEDTPARIMSPMEEQVSQVRFELKEVMQNPSGKLCRALLSFLRRLTASLQPLQF